MANPYFDPTHSTNEIWRGQDDTICLEDDLVAIEEDISNLKTGKADTNHTHTGYALASHTHSEYAAANHTHSEYAAANHEHSQYAQVNHTHTGYAASSHSHALADVTGLGTALDGKADTGHSHALADVTGLGTALNGKAAASHTHGQTDITGLADALEAKADLVGGKIPESQLPSFVDDVLEYSSLSAFPAAGESGKIYVATDTNKTYRWSGTAYVEISGSIALGETASTAYRGDRGKAAYDHSQNSNVHVTAAQKAAWDGKADGDHTHTPASIGAAASSHSHSAATTSANGFMSSSDKSKLDGIATGANKYTHPSYTAKANGLYKVTVDATGHVSAAVSATKADITALGIPGTNTTYSAMTGATSSAAGTAGLVPAPAAGKQAQYLRGDGTWATPTNTTYSNATTSSAGLMSAADKTKLDGIATGANKTTVDSALSSTSTNPVQNKVINSALAGKAASNHTHTPASIGAATANHTHEAQIITAHMSPNTYTVQSDDDYINVPLDSTVIAGSAFTLVNHKVRIGAGVSKVMISAQLCIASGNTDINRYLAIRKNTNTQLARSQLKLHYVTLPQSMAITSLLVNVAEGDLLSLDFYGKKNDIIYGNNVLTYLTVQKIV